MLPIKFWPSVRCVGLFLRTIRNKIIRCDGALSTSHPSHAVKGAHRNFSSSTLFREVCLQGHRSFPSSSRDPGAQATSQQVGEMLAQNTAREPVFLSRLNIEERDSPAISNGQRFIRANGTLFSLGSAETSSTTPVQPQRPEERFQSD